MRRRRPRSRATCGGHRHCLWSSEDAADPRPRAGERRPVLIVSSLIAYRAMVLLKPLGKTDWVVDVRESFTEPKQGLRRATASMSLLCGRIIIETFAVGAHNRSESIPHDALTTDRLRLNPHSPRHCPGTTRRRDFVPCRFRHAAARACETFGIVGGQKPAQQRTCRSKCLPPPCAREETFIAKKQRAPSRPRGS